MGLVGDRSLQGLWSFLAIAIDPSLHASRIVERATSPAERQPTIEVRLAEEAGVRVGLPPKTDARAISAER